jgi:hypothetical protein
MPLALAVLATYVYYNDEKRMIPLVLLQFLKEIMHRNVSNVIVLIY